MNTATTFDLADWEATVDRQVTRELEAELGAPEFQARTRRETLALLTDSLRFYGRIYTYADLGAARYDHSGTSARVEWRRFDQGLYLSPDGVTWFRRHELLHRLATKLYLLATRFEGNPDWLVCDREYWEYLVPVHAYQWWPLGLVPDLFSPPVDLDALWAREAVPSERIRTFSRRLEYATAARRHAKGGSHVHPDPLPA